MDTRQTLSSYHTIFHHRIRAVILATVFISTSAAADNTAIAEFSLGKLDGWQEKSFAGNTTYQLRSIDNRQVLQASSTAAASGMFKEHTIDLNKTPYLNWSWRVDNIFQGNNERHKDGDDYPARIYVVVSGGIFFWRTRAINYVWSSQQGIGKQWDNAYTENAKMLALRSGSQTTGQWFNEKRDVRADLKKMFGEEFSQIDAIAVMTDSDNTGQSATAYYGDIYFSAD